MRLALAVIITLCIDQSCQQLEGKILLVYIRYYFVKRVNHAK